MTEQQAFRVFIEMAHHYAELLAGDFVPKRWERVFETRHAMDIFVTSNAGLFREVEALGLMLKETEGLVKRTYKKDGNIAQLLTDAHVAIPLEYTRKVSALALELLFVGVTQENYDATLEMAHDMIVLLPIDEAEGETVISVMSAIHA